MPKKQTTTLDHPMTEAEGKTGQLNTGELFRLLKGVSRSLYLSLRILPHGLGLPLGIAYLLARAADTIADTSLLPAQERMARLEKLRESVTGKTTWQMETPITGFADDSEKLLIYRLNRVLACHRQLPGKTSDLVSEFITQVTGAMTWDLSFFPPENSGQLAALANLDELDRYCWLAAGTAGRLWTRLLEPTALGMEEMGIAYGKGLQLINILRDLPRDLRIGRCYLPLSDLTPLGLKPMDLLDPENAPRLLPLYQNLITRSRTFLRQGHEYILALPRTETRTRLASVLPLAIGLRTLAALAREKNILDPERRVKINRRTLRWTIVGLIPRLWSNRALGNYLTRLGTF